jgi:P-aminobenzoate N-oxygenase AurF
MNAAVDTMIDAARDTAVSARYARCIKASKRVRWDIDADVFRGRPFDFSQKFLPEGLSQVDRLAFLSNGERRTLSHVQGRTYAYIFGLVERYIGAKVLELSQSYVLGDQVALEGLVRFSDEELKHQELFRRIEDMIGRGMPDGYIRTADPNDVARAVLGASTWAVLALTCNIELFTQSHYQQSIADDSGISPLYRDVFKCHWLEECQHAIMDEIEWVKEHDRLTPAERDRGVDDLIALVGAVDGILQAQAAVDAAYFLKLCDREFTWDEQKSIKDGVLRAYRWQYIVSGAQHPHFGRLLTSMTTGEQMARIQQALAPIVQG